VGQVKLCRGRALDTGQTCRIKRWGDGHREQRWVSREQAIEPRQAENDARIFGRWRLKTGVLCANKRGVRTSVACRKVTNHQKRPESKVISKEKKILEKRIALTQSRRKRRRRNQKIERGGGGVAIERGLLFVREPLAKNGEDTNRGENALCTHSFPRAPAPAL